MKRSFDVVNVKYEANIVLFVVIVLLYAALSVQAAGRVQGDVMSDVGVHSLSQSVQSVAALRGARAVALRVFYSLSDGLTKEGHHRSQRYPLIPSASPHSTVIHVTKLVIYISKLLIGYFHMWT